MAERQARDLEVRVRIPVQVQIFLLKFMKKINSINEEEIRDEKRKQWNK